MTHTLVELPNGSLCTLHHLDGGREFILRLAALGLTRGAEITVLQNFGHGPVLVGVRGSRVALGRGEASKIWVSQP